MFEPSELEKGMLTSKDNEIRTADIPERFQVRNEKVKKHFEIQKGFGVQSFKFKTLSWTFFISSNKMTLLLFCTAPLPPPSPPEISVDLQVASWTHGFNINYIVSCLGGGGWEEVEGDNVFQLACI